MSKAKKKEDLPSYIWLTLIQTETGYVLMQCESVGDKFDMTTLKLSTPDIMAIQLNNGKKALKDNVR